MPRRPSHLLIPVRPVAGRGFSFVELLFAVAVLGIGFIMLAALFPVGLQQTKLTLDETAAAASARGAAARLSQLAQSTFQYTTAAGTVRENSTEIFPDTYVGAVPAVPVGQTVTRVGQVRSFRDQRNFVDAGAISTANANLRRDKLWSLVSPLLLDGANERNAVSLMYKRDAVFTNPSGTVLRHGAGTAQLVVVNAQVANAPAYVSPSPLVTVANSIGDASFKGTTPTGFVFFNLEPRPVGVKIYYDATDGVWLAEFASIAATGAPAYGFPTTGDYKAAYNAAVNSVAVGAYLVISDDRITAPTTDIGRMNGRMFRVGVKRDDLTGDVWQLAPGNEMTLDSGADGLFNKASDSIKDDIASIGVETPAATVTVGSVTANQSQLQTDGFALAYVLGRGFDSLSSTPGSGSNNYAGPAQDVAIYTTFVAVP